METEQNRRSRLTSILVVAGLVAAMFVVGAAPSSAWTNKCTDESTIPNGGDELGVDVGPGVAFVGIDTEAANWTAGSPAVGVCVNNEFYEVTLTTTSGVYAWVNHCSGSSCTFAVGDTGLVTARPQAVTTANTTVCAGVCTAIPGAARADTGYSLYAAGTGIVPLCVSVGMSC